MRGFHFAERPDGILVYSFKDSEKNTIDDWVKKSLKIQEEYDTNHRHLRVIHQLPTGSLSTTSPYAVRQTISLVGSRSSTLSFSSAIIIPNLYFDMAVQYINKRIPYSEHIHPFKDFEEAVTWLNERHRRFQQGLPLVSDDHI